MTVIAVLRRFVWLLLAVLFAIGLACVFVPPSRHLRELQRRKAEVLAENLRTQDMIRELRVKQQRFDTDPTFVERTARETGRVNTNEVVFKFQE